MVDEMRRGSGATLATYVELKRAEPGRGERGEDSEEEDRLASIRSEWDRHCAVPDATHDTFLEDAELTRALSNAVDTHNRRH